MLQQFLQCLFYLYEKNDRCLFKTFNNIVEIVLSILVIKMQSPKEVTEQIGKFNVYHYSVGEKHYKILSLAKRGPNKFNVYRVEGDNGKDITETMKEFLGPNEDWHKIPYRLKDFELEKMTFFLQNGETRILENADELLPTF